MFTLFWVLAAALLGISVIKSIVQQQEEERQNRYPSGEDEALNAGYASDDEYWEDQEEEYEEEEEHIFGCQPESSDDWGTSDEQGMDYTDYHNEVDDNDRY